MKVVSAGRWVCILGMLACGGEEPPDDDGPFRFEDLSDDEKLDYMTSNVLPRMQEVFQGYDADAYSNFSCVTCHVTGSTDGSYAMPDPGLPPLREEDFPYTSAIGVFMADEVLPEIQELLGPKDGGRPCITCHPLAE